MLEVSELPASLPPISTPVITQPITEQVGITTSLFIFMLFFVVVVLFRQFQFQATLETVATVVPALDSSPPPLVVDSPTELLSAAATPDVAQSAAELVVDAAPTALEVLQAAAAEPSLAELGLANHTPVGLIQNMLEFMHVDLGLPWWGAIVVGKCNLK